MSNDCEQVILSSKETCSIYNRLAKAEADALYAKNLFDVLKEEAILPPDTFYFDFFGDAGEIGTAQTALMNRLIEDNPHVILMAGDNTYTYPLDLVANIADHAFVSRWREECRVFPALGNRDLNVEPMGEITYDLYPYLPNNRRYYSKYFKNTGTEIFVLNVGWDSSITLIEPDGDTVGSIQYQWFVDAVTKSTAKWKIVMFHHPFFSQSEGASPPQYISGMNWEFGDFGIDLVINGHSHLNVHHEYDGVPYVQTSMPVKVGRDTRHSTDDPYSIFPGVVLKYKDVRDAPYRGLPAYGRLVISQDKIVVQFVDIATGSVFHCFVITNCNEFPLDEICPGEIYNWDCPECAV